MSKSCKTTKSFVRSTQSSLKFSNATKLQNLNVFLNEYRRVMQLFIDEIWNYKYSDIRTLQPKAVTDKIASASQTFVSARAVQCAGKQASAIVRGTRKKYEQRQYKIDQFAADGRFDKARKLRKIQRKSTPTKPNISQLPAELDSRFVEMDFENHTTFDGWITLTSLGNRMKLQLPVKRTKHFNKLLDKRKGTLKGGIRICERQITFMFDVPKVTPVKKSRNNRVLGIDVGQNATIATSSGHLTSKDNHGHTLGSISDRLSRKRKGSKAFRRAQSHRTNYINWSCNRINMDGVDRINIEKLHDMRRYQRTSRRLSHFTYTAILNKLERLCEDRGVLVNRISPTYTSQRCSVCGWTRRSNRNGSIFKCGKCNHTCNSDLNAAANIALDLPDIPGQVRRKHLNVTGFYWTSSGISMVGVVKGQERIVSAVGKPMIKHRKT
jgi:putative transposase